MLDSFSFFFTYGGRVWGQVFGNLVLQAKVGVAHLFGLIKGWLYSLPRLKRPWGGIRGEVKPFKCTVDFKFILVHLPVPFSLISLSFVMAHYNSELLTSDFFWTGYLTIQIKRLILGWVYKISVTLFITTDETLHSFAVSTLVFSDDGVTPSIPNAYNPPLWCWTQFERHKVLWAADFFVIEKSVRWARGEGKTQWER